MDGGNVHPPELKLTISLWENMTKPTCPWKRGMLPFSLVPPKLYSPCAWQNLPPGSLPTCLAEYGKNPTLHNEVNSSQLAGM